MGHGFLLIYQEKIIFLFFLCYIFFGKSVSEKLVKKMFSHFIEPGKFTLISTKLSKVDQSGSLRTQSLKKTKMCSKTFPFFVE